MAGLSTEVDGQGDTTVGGRKQGTDRQVPNLEKAGVSTQTKSWGRGTVRSLDD